MRKLNVLNVRDIIRYHSIKFIHHYNNDKTPMLLKNILVTNLQHHYNTRNHCQDNVITNSLYKNCKTYWSSIQDELNNTENYKGFSKRVKNHLIIS